MQRNTRLIPYTIASSEGSTTRNLSISLLLVLLLYIIGIPQVPASMLSSADCNHALIIPDFDVHDVSYRDQWLKSLRAEAKEATKEDAPYLAIRIWELLANAGDRDAAFRLGLYYDVGDAQERNADRAVYWYRQAATAGEIHAQHNLGVAYAKGDGVMMDINMAIKWWTLAARRGNTDSQYNLGILYAVGEYGIKKDIELAKHWWHKAAMHGDPMAQYNLGTLYVNTGVHDYCEAAHWWTEAARNGVEQASLALRVIKTREDYQACH